MAHLAARRVGGPALVAALACLSTVLLAAPASAAVSHRNCTELQKTYPHGVGRANAVDRVTSGRPVTTWKKDTKAYDAAMRANRGLDRDRDGVACEKR